MDQRIENHREENTRGENSKTHKISLIKTIFREVDSLANTSLSLGHSADLYAGKLDLCTEKTLRLYSNSLLLWAEQICIPDCGSATSTVCIYDVMKRIQSSINQHSTR